MKIKTLLQSLHTDRLPLWANFSWTFVGNTTYSFSQFALIAVMAKLGSPEMVGAYSLALAISTPVFMLSNLDLATVQSADMRSTRTFGDYLGLRLLCSLAAMTAVIIILWLGRYKGEVASVIALVAFADCVETINDVAYGLIQKHERLDMISRSLMVRGFVSLVAMALALYFFHSLPIALIIQVVVWCGVLWTYDLPNARRWQSIRPRFEPRTLMGLLWLAMPLGVIAGLNSMSMQAPRFAMEHFAGQRELGIFSAIAALGAVNRLITEALAKSALPRLSRLYAQEAFDRFVGTLLRLMGIGVAVGALGMLGAIVWGKLILSIVYTEEYATHTDVLILIMANVGVVAAFTHLGTALAASKRFAIQMPIHIAKLATIGALCLLLVPGQGAVGAAWATLGGSLMSSLVYGFVVWRTIRQATRSRVYEVSDASTIEP
jgi:O-antigen/teichoic acid export membrane protein